MATRGHRPHRSSATAPLTTLSRTCAGARRGGGPGRAHQGGVPSRGRAPGHSPITSHNTSDSAVGRVGVGGEPGEVQVGEGGCAEVPEDVVPAAEPAQVSQPHGLIPQLPSRRGGKPASTVLGARHLSRVEDARPGLETSRSHGATYDKAFKLYGSWPCSRSPTAAEPCCQVLARLALQDSAHPARPTPTRLLDHRQQEQLGAQDQAGGCTRRRPDRREAL